MGWGVMDWIDLAQDRDRCKRGNETSGSIKYGEFLDWLSNGQLPWSELVSELVS